MTKREWIRLVCRIPSNIMFNLLPLTFCTESAYHFTNFEVFYICR